MQLNEPMAIVSRLKPSSQSILKRAGNPCRDSLELHCGVDIISNFIFAVRTESMSLELIKLQDITGKAVLINGARKTFVVKQPNTFERH